MAGNTTDIEIETEIIAPLTSQENKRLAQLVSIVDRYQQSWYAAGDALREIRDSRLYRATHTSFESFAADKWGVSRPRAYEMIDSSKVIRTLSVITDSPLPANVAQANALRRLKDPAEQISAWKTVVAEGGEITTKRVDAAVKEQIAKSNPEPSKPARVSRKQRIAAAWLEIDRVFGPKSGKWVREGRMTDDEVIEFLALDAESDKKQVRQLMLQNRSFREAVDSLTGLNPGNTIQDLHTETLQNDGFFLGQIGEFQHAVAFGEKGRAELLERLKGWPNR